MEKGLKKKNDAILKLKEWLFESNNEILRLTAIDGFFDLMNDDLAQEIMYITKEDKSLSIRTKAIELISYSIGQEQISKKLSNKIIDDFSYMIKNEKNKRISISILNSIFNHFGNYFQEVLQILLDTICNDKNREVLLTATIAFQLFKWSGIELKNIAFQKIVDQLKDETLESIRKYYLCYSLGMIGEIDKGYQILKDLYTKAEISDSLINEYKKHFNVTIDIKIAELKEKAQADGSKVLLDKINELESEIKEKDEAIQQAVSIAKKTHERVDRSIKVHDFFISEERKEGLQTQIDLLREDLTYVKRRADEKITIKDEFSGAWKTISFIALILGALGSVVSIVLIILKIINIL